MWKKISTIVGSIILLITFIGGILTVDSRYAKSNDLKDVEIQTIQTLKQFRVEMKQLNLEDRYFILSDRIFQLKLMIKNYPNDNDLINDLTRALDEKKKIKEKLDKIRNEKN